MALRMIDNCNRAAGTAPFCDATYCVIPRKLLSAVQLGPFTLQHRVVIAVNPFNNGLIFIGGSHGNDKSRSSANEGGADS